MNEPRNGSRGSLPRRLEISKIGRRLILLGRHQQAASAQIVGLLADPDVALPIGADVFGPSGPRIEGAAVALGHAPGSRQGMVYHRDLIVEQIGIGLAKVEPLFDDALIVRMQWNAARVVDARALEVARLDLQHAVTAGAVRVDPAADGIAVEGGCDVVRPIAAVGVDSAMGVLNLVDPDV